MSEFVVCYLAAGLIIMTVSAVFSNIDEDWDAHKDLAAVLIWPVLIGVLIGVFLRGLRDD